MEETGYSAKDMKLLGSFLRDNRRTTEQVHAFLATNLTEAELPGDIEEDITHDWYTEEEITTLIKSGQIIHCHTLTSWALYQAQKAK